MSRNAQWEQPELNVEQPERTRELPEPNMEQPEPSSGSLLPLGAKRQAAYSDLGKAPKTPNSAIFQRQ